jgi:hypothetical protein
MLFSSLPLPVKPRDTEGASSCGYLLYTGCAHCQCKPVHCCVSTSCNAWFGANQWACCQGMFIFNVKAAQITNVSLIKFLDGGGSIVAWGRCRGHCRCVWAIRRSDYSTWAKNCTRPLSRISKWIRTTSTMTGTMPSAAPITVPTAALTETAALKWGRNVQHLDGGCIYRCWHSMLLILRRCAGWVVHNRWICNMCGWGTVVQRHVLHV